MRKILETINTNREGKKVTYQLELINCGKDRCKKCKAGSGHGPYWYEYSRNDAGKLKSKYIGKILPYTQQLKLEFVTRATFVKDEQKIKYMDKNTIEQINKSIGLTPATKTQELLDPPADTIPDLVIIRNKDPHRRTGAK